MFHLSLCDAQVSEDEFCAFSEIGDPGDRLLRFLNSLGVGGGVY